MNCVLSGNYIVGPYSAEGCENCDSLYVDQKGSAVWRIGVEDRPPSIVNQKPSLCSGQDANSFSFSQVDENEVLTKDSSQTCLYQVSWRGGPVGQPEVRRPKP